MTSSLPMRFFDASQDICEHSKPVQNGGIPSVLPLSFFNAGQNKCEHGKPVQNGGAPSSIRYFNGKNNGNTFRNPFYYNTNVRRQNGGGLVAPLTIRNYRGQLF